MAYTFDDVLAADVVTVVHRDDSRGFFVVRIGDLKQQIEITLSRHMDSERTSYWMTHAMKTPIQSYAFRPNPSVGEYPALALKQAISDLTLWYQDAVEEGHTPSDDWIEEY